jgi:hypothetical protein
MTAWGYALWGLFGSFAVEGLEFAGAIRRVGGWPWRQAGEPGPLPLAVSVLIRLAIGAGLAAAAGATGQLNGPLMALATRVASPLVVERLAQVAQQAITPETPAIAPPATSVDPPSPTPDPDTPPERQTQSGSRREG